MKSRLLGCLAGAVAALTPVLALAAPSPFGIATPDSSGSTAWAGPLAPLFQWIARQQSMFYRDLTGALAIHLQPGEVVEILQGFDVHLGERLQLLVGEVAVAIGV